MTNTVNINHNLFIGSESKIREKNSIVINLYKCFVSAKNFLNINAFIYLVVIFEENFFLKMSQIFKEKSGLRVCPIGPLLIVQMHSLEPIAFKRLKIHNFSSIFKKVRCEKMVNNPMNYNIFFY